ncbi:MAG: GNAT family N-acetyltransferase [Oscillospiraceae bacterium]|nr:GNAT family N-acetyltransferase [Oscillospiraceae bacterium]
MVIRTVTAYDTENFFRMMCLLDEETDYMMYEPGEREEKTKDLNRLRANIDAAVNGGDLLLVAENEGGDIVGYIWAERGSLNRVRHTAYIVVGIRQAYRRQGIGSEFFRRLDEWARENCIIRLELTVECVNSDAVRLYEKQGFVIEGTRKSSMRVNGEFMDEYYMAKILN